MELVVGPPSPQDGAKQKKFVDLAAEMGWEYVLVDANWDIMDNGNIHDVLRYAKSKGVGVLLWYNSGGPHNIVTEKPRDTLTYRAVRRFELELLKKWGVKGIKVDFFQSDKQNVIGLYHGLLRGRRRFPDHAQLPRLHAAARLGADLAAPDVDGGRARRGVLHLRPEVPRARPGPEHDHALHAQRRRARWTTRRWRFSDNKYPHRTTVAHELALSVFFETGWLHFADKAESYLNLPAAPKEFLKHVPVAWDDTRFVAGYPGQFAVLARRKGDTWYLAGVNGQNEPRSRTSRPALAARRPLRAGAYRRRRRRTHVP